MSAWIKQNSSQVKKHGARNASWYCEWTEPDGTRRCKSCGKGKDGKRRAQLMADQIKSELLLGKYDDNKAARTTWKQFTEEYLKSISNRSPRTVSQTETSLNHFQRLLKIKDSQPVSTITTKKVDRFKELRREERGKKKNSKISPASINKDLRSVKAALGKARRWGYIQEVPVFEMEREPNKLPAYVPEAHFTAIINACDSAQRPRGMIRYTPAEWWRGLLAFCFLTGWRISEVLALEWADVDLDEGIAITRHDANKGKRDDAIRLVPTLVNILKELKTDDPRVFPWDYDQKALYDEFYRIQKSAVLKDENGKETKLFLECREDHQCTTACHYHSFHNLRRSFATFNAASIPRDALRVLMRHKSSQTTDRYINYSVQIAPAVANLYVPDALK